MQREKHKQNIANDKPFGLLTYLWAVTQLVTQGTSIITDGKPNSIVILPFTVKAFKARVD